MTPLHQPFFKGTCWSALALAALTTTLPAATIAELEPTIVVSTRTPLGFERVSPSVAYVPSEVIESWQDRHLVDTLSRLPGVTLWSNGAIGSTSSLSIRGTESNHTSLFLDGRRLSPGFGNQYDLSFLTPANASSVEIQRGPSSVQYGSSNIGGVIDTRMQSGLGITEPQGSIFTEFGSNSFHQGGFSTRVGSDKIGFSLSGASMSTGNERPNDSFEQLSLSSRLDIVINDRLSFELVSMGFENDKQLPGDSINPTPFDYQETTSWLLSPGVRYLTDKVSAHLFYARSERNADIFEVNSAFDYSTWPATYLGDFPISNEIGVISDEVNLQVDYSLPNHSLLSLGAVFRNDEITNTNINTYSPLDPATQYQESFQQWGAYAQLLWILNADNELRFGLRQDNYSDYDNELTGNVMFIHHLRGLDASLFAKVATSYAPPAAVDLAYDSDTSTPLNAERSKSYEIGFQQALIDQRLEYSVVVFRNEINDLLSYEPSTFDTFNIEEAVTEGIETSMSYQATDRILLGCGYTYLRAVSDRLNDPRTGGFVVDPAKDVPLARRPRHLVQMSAQLQVADTISAGLHAVAQLNRQDINPSSYLQEDTEDFIVLRLVADWEVTEDWSVYGRIENLLDQDYASSRGYPALGRSFYMGAKYRF